TRRRARRGRPRWRVPVRRWRRGPRAAGSAVMREADHLCSRRQASIAATGLCRCGPRAAVRGRRALVQAGRAVAAIAVHPFGGTRARDAHLGCYMGDRAPLAALDKAVSALDCQWRITVGYESRSFQRLDELVALLSIAAGACSPHVTPAPVSTTSHPATTRCTRNHNSHNPQYFPDTPPP